MAYFVTTPIYYVNAEPHLGHAYTTIAADVITRFRRLVGDDTFFLTGTDEHGNKITQAAAQAGMDPQAFTDRVSQRFRDLLPKLGVEPDFFIRTTDAEHKAFVQQVWQRLRDADDLYEETYSGPYCTSCEAYYGDDELLEGGLCPIHKQPVTQLDEKNWFFRLSKYEQPLLAWLDANPDWIQPRTRFNEARAFVAGGLNDISVSRSSISWGVPVPWDDSQVTYVWIDALFNYASALTYARAGDDLTQRFWPPALQLLAKDILKFHAVIWPALLMSAGFELPRQLFIHGYLTMGGEKMSKTTGNVFDPFPVIEAHGADPVRFYVLREVQFGQDGSVSMESFEQRYTSELANDLGNLVSRTAAMASRYLPGALVPAAPFESDVARAADAMVDQWRDQMQANDLTNALETVWLLVRALNRHVEERAPWKLAKDQAQTALLHETLAELVEGILAVAHALSPVMPATVERIAGTFGLAGDELAARRWGFAHGRTVTPAGPLFPRLAEAAQADG